MYKLIATIVGTAVDIFYRRITLGGQVPSSGPVLLVANHPNALIDAALVARVAGRHVRMLGKAPLFEMPVVSFVMRAVGALPVYRAKDGADTTQNEATFRAVTEALVDNSAVLIFPEGISHDEPEIQKLKTGAARMALRACQAGASDLRIIPIGLVYGDKERFRSEVATCVGEPIVVAPYLHQGDAVAEGSVNASVVRALTEDIMRSLRAVTVNVEKWEDVPLLEAVDAIWRVDDPERVERVRRLASGVELLRHRAPQALDAARARVASFVRRLERLGLEPRALSPEHAAARGRPTRALAFVLEEIAVLLVGLPVATFGALFFAVPFWSVHGLYLLLRMKRDLGATVKVIASLLFFPLWHLVATYALWRTWGASVALMVAMLAPIAGMITRPFFRSRRQALRDVMLFLSLSTRSRLDQKLTAERDALVAELDDLSGLVEKLRSTAETSDVATR